MFGLIAAGRTISQNAKMWACLTDIALAKPEGRAMSPEAWKSAFMSALGYEIIWQPGIDNSARTSCRTSGTCRPTRSRSRIAGHSSPSAVAPGGWTAPFAPILAACRPACHGQEKPG
ncbi:recombination protein NinB [Paracoccus sp. (in: a-proteobacteria)]|uniref:recombination protein NinB n=1 Tax=Paracoccus sp. TaxID=267 RepID=UPI00333F5F42